MPREQETLASMKFLLNFTIDWFIDSLTGTNENCSPVSQEMNQIPWSLIVCTMDSQTKICHSDLSCKILCWSMTSQNIKVNMMA